MMEKPTWRKIERNSSKPCPRWGHACCVIGDEVLFFGGYADSNYMNDLWTYHATQKQWLEVQTSGQRPSHRSNCTMNYDPLTNQIVVFGGGGPNKQRFNTVSVLDWGTKVWREIAPLQNESSPWERTYHVAELSYPYLVVFGGEGLSDMDDLWVFNFITQRWTEVRVDKDATRPCARRFHSSCLIGKELFVIAGCHSKYRCLSDVYSMDLTPLLSTGSMQDLRWVERKLKGASFLSRWGHSSVVFDGKIYVFAGRFSSDLNDVLVIDVATNSLKGLKIGGSSSDHPKPRRRHCGGFVGSCMIVFGGFNGQYFNDLHYINVFELNTKNDFGQQEGLIKYAGCEELSDRSIMTNQGHLIPVHQCLISRYFKSQQQCQNYLEAINGHYSKEQLLSLLETLYRGYGKSQDPFLRQFQISLPETLNRRWLLNPLLQTELNSRNMLAIAQQAGEKTTEWVVGLRREEYERFVEKRRSLWHLDGQIILGEDRISVNKALLALHSPYFRYLFSEKYCENEQRNLSLHKEQINLPLHKSYSFNGLEILLNSMMIGALIVPQDYSLERWIELTELSDYFCLSGIRSACEGQLCARVTQQNCQTLEYFADQMGLNNLAMHCASQSLQRSLRGQRSCGEWVGRLKELLRLDLAHNSWQSEKTRGVSKKGENESGLQEKENNRQCSNV